MKKILTIISFLVIILCIYKQNEITIPSDSIRLRIIPNSNSIGDQNLKKLILKNLEDEISNLSGDSIEETRKNIINNISIIEDNINTTLINNNYDANININYGNNYFPKKEYKGIIYEEGEYESLVITIGNGEGNNFWCILFPPLCNINETEDIKYAFLIKEILKRYK